MNKKSIIEAQKIVDFLIKSYKLKENVISIYTMGSFAEGNISKYSDIDLNIFLKKTDFEELFQLKNALKATEKRFGREIDNNIISGKEFEEGVINTIIFPHKYRHALLIYELKHYNALLYGKDILKKVNINYSELYEESLKLLLTLGYRIRKTYLAGGTLKESKKQAVKFVIYACKFALINKRIYMYDNDQIEREFIKRFRIWKIYQLQQNVLI